jgi:transketolase N-terminal domain/subunit
VDLRHPEARFGDKFVLVAGHCNPVVYAMLAVYNEALRQRHEATGDARFAHPLGREYTLLPEDLLTLRQNGGLPGHAEMEGRTLFFKANTGPSGHGAPVAAGEALALKHAGAGSVRVFAVEGEGGHTAGAHHEVKNTAWGLGLGNLVYLLDWNDCGIDGHRCSDVVHGTPADWFRSYGWRVAGTEDGSNFESLLPAFHELLSDREGSDGRGASVPACLWFRTRKGRGYLKYDERATARRTPSTPRSSGSCATSSASATASSSRARARTRPRTGRPASSRRARTSAASSRCSRRTRRCWSFSATGWWNWATACRRSCRRSPGTRRAIPSRIRGWAIRRSCRRRSSSSPARSSPTVRASRGPAPT